LKLSRGLGTLIISSNTIDLKKRKEKKRKEKKRKEKKERS